MQTKETNEILQKLLQESKQKSYNSKEEEISDSQTQIERLLSRKWNNPYDVLLLDMDATQEQIKTHRRNFMMSLHPNKTDHPQAKDAFGIVQEAYQTLQDQKQRYIYQRIFSEAQEKTLYERSEINKDRQKRGLSPLPEDTFKSDLQMNCRKIFGEIEEKKNQLLKMDEQIRLKKKQELELMALKQHYNLLTEEEWDSTRTKRIQKWKDFQKRNNKIGSRDSDGSIRNLHKKNNQFNDSVK